ncbi:FAD binding domain-containing protein [Fusobacterium sp. PH5-44]|uniref:FAD binding domain-containing protein n=1 Tax=unclassified Fusobacterium TaxID=2648384 RepID=UPI003D1E377A
MVSFNPKDLKTALSLLGEYDLIPYAGGTDLMTEERDDDSFLFLDQIKDMKNITKDEEYIRIGGACTFTEILENNIVPQVLKTAISHIAAPAIRNLGTSGGNIANGSPKADSALIYYALDGKVRLCSEKAERIVPINEFYLGRNKTILAKDELLTEILIPHKDFRNYYYKKIGARKSLAISRVSFVGILEIRDRVIYNFAVAFGAIDNTVLRFYDIEKKVIGKTIEEVKKIKDQLIKDYSNSINPITGRISAEYRKTVCINLLKDFLSSNDI